MVGISLSAQNVAVKTNLLYDASATINLGTAGLSTKTRNGNIGWHNPKPATGSASVSTAIFWVPICWEDNTTGAASSCHSVCSTTWRIIGTKAGMPAVVWYTVTSGCWASAGASKRPSVWAISVPIMTSTSVCIAVNG